VPSKLTSHLFKAGDVIYRAGQASETVFLIEQGEVEVLRTSHDGETHLLGMLGPGKIFGESGVILDQPRLTTTRAHTNVVVRAVDRVTFLAQFKDAPLAMPLLRMLCERLIDADRHLLSESSGDGVDLVQIGQVRLLAASDFVKNQIGHRVIDIARLPFRVGRRPVGEQAAIPHEIDLEIVSRDTLQMSHEHFAIRSGDGKLLIEDLDSQTGTLVNGRRIARFAESRVAPLNWGENAIVVGAVDSPIRFLLIVERKTA